MKYQAVMTELVNNQDDKVSRVEGDARLVAAALRAYADHIDPPAKLALHHNQPTPRGRDVNTVHPF